MLRPRRLRQHTGLVRLPSVPLQELMLSLSLAQLSLVGMWHSSSCRVHVCSRGLGWDALQQRREGLRRSTMWLQDRCLQRRGLLQAVDQF